MGLLWNRLPKVFFPSGLAFAPRMGRVSGTQVRVPLTSEARMHMASVAPYWQVVVRWVLSVWAGGWQPLSFPHDKQSLPGMACDYRFV